MDKNKAVVLLSGGIDSATALAVAKKEGFIIDALSFSYGQRHSIEINASKKIAEFFKVNKHIILNIDADVFSSSSLLKSSSLDVPVNRDTNSMDDIPSTYVPGRNILFLSYALSYAEASGAYDIFIGVNAVDYSGYPDCRPEFIDAFERMSNIGTKTGIAGKKINIRAPLITLKKSEIIKLGDSLNVDYSLTHSCYNPTPGGLSCGICDSCIIRKEGFREAGVKDPTKYSG